MEIALSKVLTTRSQAAAASTGQRRNAGVNHSKLDRRSTLLDVTNDSPIAGVAAGSVKTPGCAAAAKGKTPTPTPGSGESLLRCQVKTLLQKVVEEEEVVEPPSAPGAAFRVLLGHLRSPGELLAPTPANTPLVCDVGMVEQLEECQLNRALLFDDSPEKSDVSATSSSLTFQGIAPADDRSSTWSVQANPTPASAAEEEKEEEEEECYCRQESMGEEEDDDKLLEWLRNLSVAGEMKKKKNGGLPAFAGKHVRFVYDSDGELERREEEVVVAPNARSICASNDDDDR